ncbi:MAG: VOC family protein [Solirubrobacterales bacterium]|nr:VOC family protein [Solirubrobacterales bacterium]
MESRGDPLVTHTDFVMVPTKDFERAIDFFGSVLGLPESKRYGERPGVEFETGNLTLSVMQSDAFGIEFKPNPNPIALRVENVDEARATLESHGIEFVAQFDSGVCHQAIFHDHDGNAFALHHRYAPADELPDAAKNS